LITLPNITIVFSASKNDPIPARYPPLSADDSFDPPALIVKGTAKIRSTIIKRSVFS